MGDGPPTPHRTIRVQHRRACLPRGYPARRPLRSLRDLRAPYEVLRDVPDDGRVALRELHLEIESEPLASAAALVRSTHLTISRTRWCTSDPIDLRAWATGAASLELRQRYPYAERNTQLVAHALHKGTPRPSSLVYAFHEHRVTITRDELHIVRDPPPPPTEARAHLDRAMLTPFHAVLSAFARVRVSFAGGADEADAFDGTGADALARLQRR